MVADVLQCSLNPIVSPRRILFCESHNGIHDNLWDSWPAGLTFVTGIKLSGHEPSMPTQDRVWRDNGGQFQQSLASDGVSLYGKQATLVVVEQQAFLSELFEQGFDLSILKLNDLLLAIIGHATEGREKNVPWLEDEGHDRRRNMASVRRQHLKSSRPDERIGLAAGR